jgi:hypothetical protein
MDINLFNIDSKFRNTTANPNSSNFVFNRMEETVGTDYRIEPFNQKNIIEMNIDSFEFTASINYISSTKGNNTITIGGVAKTIPNGSYTKSELINILNTFVTNLTFSYSSGTDKVTINNTTGGSITITATTSTTDFPSISTIIGFLTNTTINNTSSATGTATMLDSFNKYFFMRINDIGNVMNKNRRYFAKIIVDSQASQDKTYKIVTNRLKFEQPTDINNLRIILEDEYGSELSINGNYSFTLETVVITNTILKNYSEIIFYSEQVMDRILKAKMLAFYENKVDKGVNNTLTSTYSSNLTNLNNMQEYSTFGSKNNYAPSFSYFIDSDKNN